MCKTKWIKIGFFLLLTSVIITGYGPWCGLKPAPEDTAAGSSSGEGEVAYGAQTTPPPGTTSAPTVYTDPATNVTASTFTLNGRVNPNGLATTYYFEIGTTSYTQQFPTPPNPPSSAGSGTSLSSVSQPLSGANRYTTYNFRIVATNSAGTTNGANQSFTTP